MALILCPSDELVDEKDVNKILIAAECVGVQVQLSPYSIEPIMTLETPDGAVFGGNAIARYVAQLGESNLFGSSLIDQAHIDRWIDFSTGNIDANIMKLYLPRLRFGSDYLPADATAVDGLRRAFEVLNTHLAHNFYLLNYSFTIADIIVTSTLHMGYAKLLDENFTSEFPHVDRYFWTLVCEPNFQKILGKVKQTEAMPTKQPKESNPKTKDELKKVAKSEAEKPKVEEDEEEARINFFMEVAKLEAEKPKPPLYHLLLLPPSKLILDDWKRLYSITTTTDFREVAIKGFWDMYDPKGYSLWFCDYKYNDENKASFLPLNRVAGFLHRMVLARKYAFGKMLIIGTEPPFKVKGLWLFRGQDIQPFIKDCYDMELYEWTKVDISDEGQKERVSQMIEDAEPFEGEALLDAMCFK